MAEQGVVLQQGNVSGHETWVVCDWLTVHSD